MLSYWPIHSLEYYLLLTTSLSTVKCYINCCTTYQQTFLSFVSHDLIHELRRSFLSTREINKLIFNYFLASTAKKFSQEDLGIHCFVRFFFYLKYLIPFRLLSCHVRCGIWARKIYIVPDDDVNLHCDKTLSRELFEMPRMSVPDTISVTDRELL